MSMIDDASDETKNAIKEARRREQERREHDSEAADAPAGGSDDDRDTSGDVPVANLE